MDSVVVFFAHATQADVEAAAAKLGLRDGTVTRGETNFYFWPYTGEEQSAELEPSERDTLEATFGRAPECAFLVSSRHGEAARFALQVVGNLMSQFSPSAMDDDFGQLMVAEEVLAAARKNPPNGIYFSREQQ
ncbi:MAG: hypothetical protein ACK5QH_19255 [Rubrivivax sp.]|jgi:hypothetical protein